MQRKLAALLAVTVSLALAQAQAADFKPITITISSVKPVVDKHANGVDSNLVKQAFAAIQASRK